MANFKVMVLILKGNANFEPQSISSTFCWNASTWSVGKQCSGCFLLGVTDFGC